MDKKIKKIYSIKGTLIPPSPIYVVPGEVEFTPQEDTYYKEILCNVCEEPVRTYTPTDYACPKCHPEKFNHGEKDKFYRRFLTHEEQMVGAELFQKAFVGFQKVEPKPECDHIVGEYYNYDDTTLVSISTLLDKDFHIAYYQKTESDVLKSKISWIEKGEIIFYFCPKKGCGAPIDWEKIEESLKQSNEKE